MTTQFRSTAGDSSPSRLSWLDRFFEITVRGSTVGTEVRGGLATFATMAYIIPLNAIILTAVPDVNGNRLNFLQVAVMTCAVAAVTTFSMGVVARHPFAIAAGLGINSYLAVQVASRVSWPAAMGLVVIEGLIVLVLVLVGVREAVLRAIPASIRVSIGMGIGAFLLFIAFVDAGFSRRLPDLANTSVPVGMGIGGRLAGWPVVVFVMTTLIILALLAIEERHHIRPKAAILVGIVAGTILAMVVQVFADLPPMVGANGVDPYGWALNVPEWPDKLFVAPDFGLFGRVAPLEAFDTLGLVAAVPLVITLLVTDFFDTIGSSLAVAKQGDLLDDEGELPRTKEVLAVDAAAAVVGGIGSVSSNTVYIESAAGVGEGARTGLASVVTAVLFGLAIIFTPLAQIVPMEVGAAALVAVAIMMIRHSIAEIEWSDMPTAAAAVLTILAMPFTYSITNGIGVGVLVYTFLMVVTRRAREVHWLMYGVTLLFVVYFVMGRIQEMLGA